VNVVTQKKSIGMLVEYEAPRLVDEVAISHTKPSDAKHVFLSTFGLYSEEAKVEYSLEHKESMEI
jgi:hypothetical protein